MDERQIAIDRARARLELWEDRLAGLQNAPACATKPGEEMYAQYTQELTDRLESVRIKLEKLDRAGGHRLHGAREELERAFSALQTAWDTAVAKIAWTNPLANE
jgi:hypothetical protein